VSVTGVAGPEPDEKGNPVGRVYFACTRKGGKCVGVKREFGDIGRSRVRLSGSQLRPRRFGSSKLWVDQWANRTGDLQT
jgi:nicotinamide mononucleotide (NMN) deamidase PncC